MEVDSGRGRDAPDAARAGGEGVMAVWWVCATFVALKSWKEVERLGRKMQRLSGRGSPRL